MNLSKYFADQGNVNIVLVSSEEQIPLLQKTSSITRAASAVEVLDLKKTDAIAYITKFNVPNPELLVNFTGGRIIYLNQSIQLFKYLRFVGAIKSMKDEDIYVHIIEELTIRNVYPTMKSFHVLDVNLKYKIMHHVSKKEERDMFKLRKLCGDCDYNDFYMVLQQLVNCHMLCYITRGTVTWHNNMVKNYILHS